jgi:thioredoxin 1
MSDQLVTITDTDFAAQVLGTAGVVLVEFTGSGCPACVQMGRLLASLDDDYPQVDIRTMDLVTNPNTMLAYGIMSVPTIILFDGGKEAARLRGAVSRSALTAMLDGIRAGG